MPSVVKDFKGNKDAVVSTVARIKSLNLMKILPQWSFYSSLVDTCLFLCIVLYCIALYCTLNYDISLILFKIYYITIYFFKKYANI